MITLCPGCHQIMGFSWVYGTGANGKKWFRWECKSGPHDNRFLDQIFTYKLGCKIGEDMTGEKVQAILKKHGLSYHRQPPSRLGYINLDAVREDLQRMKNPVNECPNCKKQESWEDGRIGPATIISHHPCKSCYDRE